MAQGFTGQLPLTMSYAMGALTASWALSASYAPGNPSISASYAETASYAYVASQAISASWAPGSTQSESSSWASASISASYAETASYVIGAANTVFASQSVYATQSIFAYSASWASASISSSYAETASYALNVPETASYALQALSASWAPQPTIPTTISYSLSSSWASSSVSSSYAEFAVSGYSASYAVSASWAPMPVIPSTDSASWASSSVSASYAETASYALNIPDTSSYALYAISASYAYTSSYELTIEISSSWASSSISSSYALTASYALNATPTISASWASQSLSASRAETASFTETSSVSAYSTNADTASFALTAVSADFAITSTYADTASYSTVSNTASYAISASWAPSTGGGSSASSSWASSSLTASLLQTQDNLTNVIPTDTSVTFSINNTQVLTVADNTVDTKWERSGSMMLDGVYSGSNINVGIPVSFDWVTGLEGSYFQNWNSATYVSEMLRFFAGAFSASFPNPTPNTRTYSSITTNQNNAGSTVTIDGRIPQNSTDVNINYLVSKGWGTVGGGIFTSATFRNSSTFNTTYTSVIGGTTVVSSSIGATAFGLGPLNNGNLQTFYVSASVSESFYDNSASTLTFVTSSNTLYSQSSANTSGFGLQLAKIPTSNAAIIPSAYQDGNYVGVSGSGLIWNNSGNNLSDISSSGKYLISASIAIASGSSPYTSFVNATAVAYYYTPVTNELFATNTLATVGVATSSLIATSRSLSGAPYLTTGSVWTYTFTGSGAFNPMYFNGTVSTCSFGTNAAGVYTRNTTSASVSNGLIQGGGAIVDSSSLTPRTVGTVPYLTDLIVYNLYLTASGTGTNITQTGLSSTGIPVSSSLVNRAGTSTQYGMQNIPYHIAGTYGQPSASGSLAYYGRPQGYSVSTDTGTTETFADEALRIKIEDACVSFSGSAFTSSISLNAYDLQVKPGYLVDPGGSYRYWYPSGYGNGTKYYVRRFRRTSTITTLTINPGILLNNWDSPASGAAVVLLFESAISGAYGNCRIYDINKIGSGFISNVTTSFMNPFTPQVDVYENNGGTVVGTTITVPIDNSRGMYLQNDSTKDEFYLIVRYIGDPTSVISNISVTP